MGLRIIQSQANYRTSQRVKGRAILGAMELGRGFNGSPQLVVRGDVGPQLAECLGVRLGELIVVAVGRGEGLCARAADLTVVAPERFNAGLLAAADRGPDTPLYTLRYNEQSRGIECWSGQAWEPNKTPKTAVVETRQLIALRDAFNSLVTSQGEGWPASERDQLRGHLNLIYDAYVAKYGPVDRFTWVIAKDITQHKHDERIAEYEVKWRAKEGEPGKPYRGPIPDRLLDEWQTKAWKAAEPYKKQPPLGGMRHDPGWGVVSALEIFEEASGQARKAPIFSTDVLTASRERISAASPEEALAMSMDRLRRVDLDLTLLDVDVDRTTARELLHGLVYPSVDDPDHLVPAVTALSGNVREKLVAAGQLVRTGPSTTTTCARWARSCRRSARQSRYGSGRVCRGFQQRWWAGENGIVRLRSQERIWSVFAQRPGLTGKLGPRSTTTSSTHQPTAGMPVVTS